MPFNLLLLPLIGGFYFFSKWEKTAYFATRHDKERLIFYSSLYGFILLSISFGLSTLIPYSQFFTELRTWWAYHTPSIQYSGISSLALGLGLVAPSVLNVLERRIRSILGREVQEGEDVLMTYGSQLEKLFYRSLIEGKRVMVTLKSGKVYIGRVTISVLPQRDKDFLMLPSLSGYRDEKHRVVLTTNYDFAYKAIVEGEKDYIEMISDFGVVIPISEVVSATIYRADVHAKYFRHEYQPEPEPRLLKENNPPSSKQLVKPLLS